MKNHKFKKSFLIICISLICFIVFCAGCGLVESKKIRAAQYVGEGLELQEQKDYLNAFDCYEKAFELNPDNPAIYLNLGLIFSDFSMWDRSIELNKRAIELYPDYVKAYGNLGYNYMHDGQIDLSEEMYNTAIEIDPKYAIGYMNRGIIYLGQNDYNRAAVDFDAAIKYDKNYALAYMNRGQVFHARGFYDLAIKYYKKALEIDNNCELADDNLMLATAMKPRKKITLGVKHAYPVRKPFDPASIESLKPDILAVSALKKLEDGNFKEAVNLCDNAISLDSDNALAYRVRGAINSLSTESVTDQMFLSGVNDLHKAHKLFPEDMLYYFYIGDVYLKMGNEKLAVKSFETYLKNATFETNPATINHVMKVLLEIKNK